MRFFLGVQGKFVLIASLCIFIFAGFGGYLIIKREEKLYTEDTIHQAKIIAEISGVIFTNALVYKELGLVENVGLTDYLDYYVSDMMHKDKRIIYLVVLDPDGKVLSHSNIREYGKKYTDPVTQKALRAENLTVQRLKTVDGIDMVDVATPLKISTKSWGVCRIGFSLEEVNKGVNALRNEIISMVSLMLIGSLVVIGFSGKAFATPLVNLAKTMDRITEKGNLDIQYPEPSRRYDEIGRLQASFSWMISRLREANREKMKTMDLMCQTEKMATVGNLAAGVAHEINNPLGGVILCFKNFTETDMDEKSRKMHIEVINSGLLKIQNTVQGLLDFARKTPIAIAPSSISSILDESLRLVDSLLAKKGITVVKELCADMPLVPVDSDKIEQVFLNIIINAVHAMGEEGTLFFASRREGGMCLVSITDTGPGIDPEVLPRIFDPFFTTKEPGKGTGLGLAVCKSIIEQHGGRIEVVSEKGNGARFIISLPIRETEKT
ncbi:two-component sensor histidine kinase [Desulfolithobacter dissulfuricans]|uniref:histidine kinase n=1 Tax=Desulfolithobacter dissulfuricans TaxID=2795293 RepID=A0A915TYB4_9BACT|nr:ATP-binding protein [Desulfolithobacter dissulfuricans]BCO08041.1 two-component sensor histidine kinase [Desulfolithobacter dissulfuricans]